MAFRDYRALARIGCYKRQVGLTVLGCVLLVSSNASATIDGLAGTWSASGSMKLSEGARERIRCKASYVVKT
jgi:hypothetical protein